VFEFIDGVHTAKNVMITAIKKDRPPRCAYVSACECAHFFWRVRLQYFLFFYPLKIHFPPTVTRALFARRRLLVHAAVKNSCRSCGSAWQHSCHSMASVYNGLQCTSGRIPRIPKTSATCIRRPRCSIRLKCAMP